MSKKAFIFNGIEVGMDQKPLVIPEIGINHNGSLDVAKQMVDAAYRAGARLIKHQTHIVWDEMSNEARKVIPGNADRSIYDIMEQCALSEEEEWELMNYVRSKGMAFISTPFSRAAADRLEKFGVAAYKIGSGEMNNLPLIRHVCEFHKPMIVSTGMNNIEGVDKTVNILEQYGVPYALLHTTNIYPTPKHLVRLGGLAELMEHFPGVPIGLSDHTVDNLACISAMAMGACIVERHFTDVMSRKGPDIICSMDETALKELLFAADSIYQMRGGKKEAVQEEQATIDFAFATVVAVRDIKSGEMLNEENIWVRRPGIGEIAAEKYEELIGRQACCDIPEGSHLSFRMLG